MIKWFCTNSENSCIIQYILFVYGSSVFKITNIICHSADLYECWPKINLCYAQWQNIICKL